MDEQKLILTHAWKVFHSQPVPKQQKHRKWWQRLSTHPKTQYTRVTTVTYAMLMQASRTTCDLRSLTPKIKLGSKTLSCWWKSSWSAAPFISSARNSLNWNTSADQWTHGLKPWNRFRTHCSSTVVVYRCFVTLPSTVVKTLKWLTLLCILMQNNSSGDKAQHQYQSCQPFHRLKCNEIQFLSVTTGLLA